MKTTLLLTAIVFGAFTGVIAQPAGLDRLEFFVGEWELETIDIQPDGSFLRGRARSVVTPILDGDALQDVFMSLNEEGEVVFKGISIRSYNQASGKFQIVWIMPGHRGITDLEGEWVNGKLVSTGRGYDAMGTFIERFEYYDITEDTYSFRMDRSYDGGNTWIENFGRINARRVK